MALTLDELEKLLNAQGIMFFVHPSRPALMFNATGMFGTYQFVIHLLSDGTFLQLRSLNNQHCPADHPNLLEVLKVLADLNNHYRLVKFGWDAGDGEIVAFADCWLVDNTLTQQQLNRMLSNYLPAVDMSYPRIKKTIETGEDPGQQTPEEVARTLLKDPSALPPALRKLLEKLRGEGKGPDIDEL